MKSYIISTDKGFKLLKELPEEPEFSIHIGAGHLPHLEWQKKCQQAIDSAPFIKNEEVAKQLLDDVRILEPTTDKPYRVSLDSYDVSEPEIKDLRCDLNGGKCWTDDNCWGGGCASPINKTFITITPKAVENKTEFLPLNAERKKIELCAKWLKYCLEIGYDKSQLDGLQKLWMDNHDYTGKFVPKVEKSEATENSAQVESQTDYILDLITTFNISTSFESVEEANEEYPKLFQSKRESAKNWLEMITRKGEAKQ